MENIGPSRCTVSILDVLGVDLCARAILDYVPVREMVRSERVCKQWQGIMLNYLQTCTLSFEGFRYCYNYIYYPVLIKDPRTIVIHNNNHSLPLVCKTLDKWGPYVTQVITDIGEDGYLDIIASKCPNVEEIEIVLSEDDERPPPPISKIKTLKDLKHIVLQNFVCFSNNNTSDQVLGELLQEMNCKNFFIFNNEDLTGSFLKYLNSNSLEALTLINCQGVRLSDLLSAIHNLRGVIRLELDDNDITVFDNVQLLLKEMPQLEELALRSYRYTTPLSEESIKSFSELANLKRLDLSGNDCVVSDSLLEALALRCKKLEYLDIRGCASTISARGVVALCRRAPAALTTLHFGYDPDYAIINQVCLENHFVRLKHIPVYQELERLGCLELNWQWFNAAFCDPRGRRLPLQVVQGTAQSGTPHPELKLVMNS